MVKSFRTIVKRDYEEMKRENPRTVYWLRKIVDFVFIYLVLTLLVSFFDVGVPEITKIIEQGFNISYFDFVYFPLNPPNISSNVSFIPSRNT